MSFDPWRTKRGEEQSKTEDAGEKIQRGKFSPLKERDLLFLLEIIWYRRGKAYLPKSKPHRGRKALHQKIK